MIKYVEIQSKRDQKKHVERSFYEEGVVITIRTGDDHEIILTFEEDGSYTIQEGKHKRLIHWRSLKEKLKNAIPIKQVSSGLFTK